MKVYNIDEICTALKIKPPVLRKYSALLEDAGYTGIQRNSSKARYYTDENLKILRELIDYKKSGHMTLTDAAKAIATRVEGIDVIEDIAPMHIEHVAQRADIERLENAFLGLTEHLELTERKNADSMELLLKELREVKEELKEVKEKENAKLEMKDDPIEEVKVKRGFFNRLFR